MTARRYIYSGKWTKLIGRCASPRFSHPPRDASAIQGKILAKITIQFTLFSAFYSPLISTISGGFLEAEGLEPDWSVSPPGVSAIAAVEDGSADVVQSALSLCLVIIVFGEVFSAKVSYRCFDGVASDLMAPCRRRVRHQPAP